MSGKTVVMVILVIVVVAGGYYSMTHRDQGLAKPATASLRIEANIGVKSSPFAQLPENRIREMISRVKSNQRTMATALESYFVDNNTYPATLAGGAARSVVKGNSFMKDLPAISPALTTPVAYLTQYFPDPFNPDQAAGSTYSCYVTDGGWILISPGTDGDFDILAQNAYLPRQNQPTPDLLNLSYDPSNGTISDGDIFRVKQ